MAGLSTGSIIAMAMDFSIWPRLQAAPRFENKIASQNRSKASLPQVKEEGSVPVREAREKIQQQTRITDKVPEDVEPIKTSAINEPVPIDSKVNGTKTLLEQSQEVDVIGQQNFRGEETFQDTNNSLNEGRRNEEGPKKDDAVSQPSDSGVVNGENITSSNGDSRDEEKSQRVDRPSQKQIADNDDLQQSESNDEKNGLDEESTSSPTVEDIPQ